MEPGSAGEMSSGWHFTFAGIFELFCLTAVMILYERIKN